MRMIRLVIYLYLCTLLASCGGGDSPAQSSAASPALVANGGPDQNVTVNQPVTLDGSNSYGPAGRPLTCAWSFASRPVESEAELSDTAAANPSFVPDISGYYLIDLRVSDGTATSSPQRVMVTAYPDPTWWFSTEQSSEKISIPGYVLPGSVFTSAVANNSDKQFRLDRYELVNCRGVLFETSAPQDLNNNELGAGYKITIRATLGILQAAEGFRSIYYFTDPANGRKYIATAIYT
jgi:hypothetical protein